MRGGWTNIGLGGPFVFAVGPSAWHDLRNVRLRFFQELFEKR